MQFYKMFQLKRNLYFSVVQLDYIAGHKKLFTYTAGQSWIKTMRGPRLFDHTDWKSRKKIFMSPDVLFSLKISVKTKKIRSSLFVIRPLVFSEAPIFSEA